MMAGSYATAGTSAVPRRPSDWGLRVHYNNKPIFKRTGLGEFDLIDGSRYEKRASMEPPLLECRAHHTGINDGDTEIFLDWAKGVLVAYLKANYPAIAAWELWKPALECIGKNVAPPHELEELWKDSLGQVSLEKIQETLDEYAKITLGVSEGGIPDKDPWPTLEQSMERVRSRSKTRPDSSPEDEGSSMAQIRTAKKALMRLEKKHGSTSAVADPETPTSPVRPFHMTSGGKDGGNKRKSKEMADKLKVSFAISVDSPKTNYGITTP
jgi:hypothetical protein